MADLPAPTAYLDHRAFLRDWFDAKKSQNKRFSHRAFVRRTGQKSPSLLADVIAGRRNLTADGLEGFITALGLSGNEAEWFSDLVAMHQAESTEERAAVLDRLLSRRHFRDAHRLEGASLRYLSHWSYAAVHELAACEGFEADPHWISRTLRPRIPVDQAREALDVLCELGLLVEGPDGALTQGQGTLVTPHEVQSFVAHRYHQGMIARAAEAVETFASEERHFCAVTVAVPRSMLPELKTELDRVQETLLSRCDSADSPAEQVLQINLQLFPLSAPTRETP